MAAHNHTFTLYCAAAVLQLTPRFNSTYLTFRQTLQEAKGGQKSELRNLPGGLLFLRRRSLKIFLLEERRSLIFSSFFTMVKLVFFEKLYGVT